jgi:SOS response regulatory protein OraA/RecX
MEDDIVQAIVMLAILALALLFFATRRRSRDQIRDRLLRKATQHPPRSHRHRHPG